MKRIPNGSQRLRLVWLGASLVYGGLRVALAGNFLSRFGLNVWVFGAIEMTSSLVLGLSSGALVASIVRTRDRRRRWLVAGTVGGYTAPDIYVLACSGGFPVSTLAVVACVVAVGLVSTTLAVSRGIRGAAAAGLDAT